MMKWKEKELRDTLPERSVRREAVQSGATLKEESVVEIQDIDIEAA